MTMPGFTAQAALDRTTAAYRDALSAIPAGGIVQSAALSQIVEYPQGSFCLGGWIYSWTAGWICLTPQPNGWWPFPWKPTFH
jgi:hypothetical protein